MPTDLQRYELTIASEADDPHQHRERLGSFDKQVTLGRGSSCDIRLEHVTVSRTHAVVEASDGELSVLNLSARGTTFVAGRLLAPNERASVSPARPFFQIGQYLLEIRPVGQTQPYMSPIPIPNGDSAVATLRVVAGSRPRFILAGTEFALPPKPGKLLLALAERPDRTSTRDALIDAVEDAEGWTNLDAIVFRLRARLDAFGQENPASSIEIRKAMDVAGFPNHEGASLGRAIIQTVRGQGYRLALPPASVSIESDD